MQPNDTQTPINKRMLNNDPRETNSETSLHAKIQPQQQRRGSAWRVPLLCLLALALTLGILELTGGIAFTSTQKALPTRTFAINGHGSLVINDGSGSFHIHEGTTDQVIIQGNEYAYGLVNNFNDIQVQYAQQGNTITLNANEGWGILGSSGVNFDITVPANLDVTIRGGSTNVDLTHIDGQVRTDIGSGNQHLNNINGPLNLNTGSGDIVINNEQGAVNAHTSSGNIHISQLTGAVDLGTGSGDITLDQAHISGQDHLQTSSGNIHFNGTLDPRGTYQMETASGDITLNLPANTSFQLTASTNSGDIKNAFNASTTGSAPYATLTLKAASGNIKLQKQL
jgi:DUF4097 and DUF4098 domain-containing protein YvlB